jgi:alginate O-acetyltransferase complex protein AlgI
VVHVLCVGLTFLCVLLAWVPFRAASMDVTWAFYQAMFGINASWTGLPSWDFLAWMVAAFFVVWGLPNAQQFLADHRPAWDTVKASGTFLWRPTAFHGVWLGVLFGVALVAVSGVGEFLYFQF